MIDALALVMDRFGMVVATWTYAWMPSLGPTATSAPIRLTAAMGVLVLAGLFAWIVLALSTRLTRLINLPWQDAVRTGLASLRLMACTAVILLVSAPFLWQTGETAPTAETTASVLTSTDSASAALPALIATWMATAVMIIAFGNLLFRIVHAIGALAMERARATKSAWDDVLLEVGTRLILGFIILGTVYVAIAVLANHPVLTETTTHLLALLVIALITWALVNIVYLADRFLMTRYRSDGTINLQARRITTQVVVLKRLAYVVIAIFAVSMALMQFDAIRHISTSILASAGLAGVVLGFAAQRTLSNLLAGMQIALTQPLRIDDSVVIEKEFGKVEEITLTYVVVGLWDQRRLIVPLSRIIDNPFKNWTRTATELLGTVTLRCDYSVPVQDLRAEAKRYVESHRLWDKRVFAVQVTDCDHRTIEVRILVSAAAAEALFDLRCEVHEYLLGWLNRVHPAALPHIMLSQPESPSPALAGSA
ncbi:MAG TPA: mechanosensitive ion channel domain-containing protein [Planctomycetota bacterium]|nr:mechanosensitive ion channel domain-containing protein [Planctomycetota bacterium]